MAKRKDLVVVALATFCLTASLFMTGSIRSAGVGEYNLWADVNNDGIVDIYDAILLSNAFNQKGQNLTKASVMYDSGWVNITDKAGQDIVISHGLGILDWSNESMIVEISGRIVPIGGLLRQLGLQRMPALNNTYGGANVDEASALVETFDGGFALAGLTHSFGAGKDDFWLVRTDASGNMLWNKTYGGIDQDEAHALVQTADGGFALAGLTLSFGAGKDDFWLVRTDASGNMLWNKTYGGTNGDDAYALVQTADGGFALAGSTLSFGAGGFDFWLVRTDASGGMLWSQTYGGTGSDEAFVMVGTLDGGFALAGSTNADFWLVRTDGSGNMLWNKTYGGTDYDWANALVQTADGGYALTGSTGPIGLYDFWLVRTDDSGNMLWNKTYGGTSQDNARALVQTADGGFALAGSVYSFGAGGFDFWLVCTDASGNMLWNKTYGGTNGDDAYALVQTADGGFALAGSTLSFGAGGFDFWLVKDESGEEIGLAWVSYSSDSITLYRAIADPYWNYVRVRILKTK